MKRRGGFAGFTILWVGQVLSACGTRMTNFAVGIWVWTQTGRATDIALLMFAAFGATILCSPLAGSLIDRWSRRLTIVLADTGSFVVTAGLLALYLSGSTQVWHLYVANLLTGAFLSFQMPAYQTTISTMIEEGRHVRANAMMGLVISVPDVFAPAVAGALLTATSIEVVLVVDALTFVVAVATVALVRLPAVIPRGEDDKPHFWRDCLAGFRYIAGRPSFIGLLGIMFAVTFLSAIGWVLLSPLVLSRTGNSASALGVVLTVGAIGGAVSGIVLIARKSTGNRILWMLGGILVLSIPGRVLFGADSVTIWAIALFLGWGAIPFIDAYNQSIWQQKVPPATQGRVFAAGQFVENLALPIAYGIAGPLADHVFEPAMREGGGLADLFGPALGTGPGSGIALMFVLSGLLGIVVGVAGYASRSIRDAETLLPDPEPARPVSAADPLP